MNTNLGFVPARVGDSVECDVRTPFRQTIRMVLETPMATALANDLLMDQKGGWRLSKPSSSSVRSPQS